MNLPRLSASGAPAGAVARPGHDADRRLTGWLVVALMIAYVLFAGRWALTPGEAYRRHPELSPPPALTLGSLAWPVSQTNYFSYLAEGFLAGRLHLVSQPPFRADLVEYRGRTYLYWPPGPAILLMPLVALFGVHVSDYLAGAVLGAVNIWLLAALLRRLRRGAELPLSESTVRWLVALFALGTVHFYLAAGSGSVWHLSQVVTVTALLASLWLLLGGERSAAATALAGLAWGGAFATRTHLLLLAPMYLVLLWSLPPLAGRPLAARLRGLVPFAAAALAVLVLLAGYNWARFGSPREFGIRYHGMEASKFFPVYQRWGYFHVHYVPINVYYNLIHGLLPRDLLGQGEVDGFFVQAAFPFIRPDPNGNSLLLISAPLLWALGWRRGARTAAGRRLGLALWLGTAAAVVPIWMLMGTGWIQFGARYLLDVHPMLLLLVASSLAARDGARGPGRLFGALVLVSVYVNVLGALWYGRYFAL